MKEYIVQKAVFNASQSSVETGSVLLPDFTNVPKAEISEILWLPDAGIRAFAQLCYDDRALYIHLEAQEKNIRAEHTGVLGMPCEDSCLEFFIAPMFSEAPDEVCGGASGDAPSEDTASDTRYFNIECNPNGALFLGIGRSGSELYRIVTESPEHMPIKPKTARIPGGWYCEYAVPYKFIRFFFPELQISSGTRMRGNFYKCGDLTEQEHYLAWNPVALPTPCFHCPDHFGTLLFK